MVIRSPVFQAWHSLDVLVVSTGLVELTIVPWLPVEAVRETTSGATRVVFFPPHLFLDVDIYMCKYLYICIYVYMYMYIYIYVYIHQVFSDRGRGQVSA